MICRICGKKICAFETYLGDAGTPYEYEPLCIDCYLNSEITAIVYYGKEKEPRIITETINQTSDFSVEWKAIDSTRGYYEVKSEKYELAIAAESMDDYEKNIREIFEENSIDYARVHARSSSKAYHAYDLYVKREQLALSRELINKAKKRSLEFTENHASINNI
jgi:hypothetical protein